MIAVAVDDEQLMLRALVRAVGSSPDITSVTGFSSCEEALDFVENNIVDVAFLDINMPNISGIELSKEIRSFCPFCKFVFITAYEHYALDAFRVNALDYLTKPYDREMLSNCFKKVGLIKGEEHRIFIKTFGGFDVFVDGELLKIKMPKVKEMLALLVDLQGSQLNLSTAVRLLWLDHELDEKSSALVRITMKRLREVLTSHGIQEILVDGVRAINPRKFDCDYYNYLKGDKDAKMSYFNNYLPEYWWARETNESLSGKH